MPLLEIAHINETRWVRIALRLKRLGAGRGYSQEERVILAGEVDLILKRGIRDTSSFQQAFCKEFGELIADDSPEERPEDDIPF